MEITRVTLQHATEAEWLAARALDLTSTECSALFGASPYATEFQLYHRKTGTLPIDDFVETERMTWGKRLESAIAYGVAEDHGLIVEPFKTYMRIPELRLGSSFDFRIIGVADGYTGPHTAARDMFAQRGPGIMEVKNVDGLQFRRGWVEDKSEGTIEAPPHIEFQVQHQLLVADMGWSIIAPLIGGNTPQMILRERDTAVGDAIMLAASNFWSMVDSKKEPKAHYLDDAKALAALYVNNDGSSVDLSDNDHLAKLCLLYKAAGLDAKRAEERKTAAKAEVLTIIKQAKSIAAKGFKISAGTNKESYRLYRREGSERVTITVTVSKIPPCDIESTVAPFRNVRITEV